MPIISDDLSDTRVLAVLIAMSVIRSFCAGIQTPAVNAVIPQRVTKDELMKYNGLNATMQAVVQFAAPVAAGAVLSVWSLGNTLLIDVATAAVGIGLLLVVYIPKIAAKKAGSIGFCRYEIRC